MPHKDTEQSKQYKREYYILNKARWKQYGKTNRVKQKEKRSAYNKPYLQRRREAVRTKLFDLLGGAKCVRCGITDIRCLQFDHINGGGYKDSRRFPNTAERWQYYLSYPEIAKTTLQVLCANCNWIKKAENKEVAQKHYHMPVKVLLTTPFFVRSEKA